MKSSSQTSVPLLFSLRGRLLFLTCLATLPAVLFTFFAAQQERTAVLARTESDALHLAELASREHAHQIHGARELLAWLGDKLAQEGRKSAIITDPGFLQAQLAGHPQLANIGVLSPDGHVLASAYPLSSDQSWSDNPAYLAALKSDDVVAGTYIISPIFERPTLNHAYAVRDEKGEVTAVLFNGLDLDWLSGLSRHGLHSEEFSLLITDHTGHVLAHDDSATPIVSTDDNLRLADVAELAQARHGRMLDIRNDGVHRYFVATPLEEASGLFVAVGLPYDRVVDDANSAFYRALAGLSFLTLFTIAAVFVAAEFGILRGLRSLALVARRFGNGDLAARVQASRGHNELASLAGAFNTMADSLAARHREAIDGQARMRALANRLQTAYEAEAERISRELHDEIGQVLTSLKIDLSRLPQCCSPEETDGACAKALRENVAILSERISAAVDFVRRISTELRPGVLDKLGLAAAIEWQAREIESRTELSVQVDIDLPESPMEDVVSLTLFRIVQESLTNVVRHAQAQAVEIRIVVSGPELVLTVHDDGKGISAESAASDTSLGLVGMRERVKLINGRFSIQGGSGKGTLVRVVVPGGTPPEEADAHPAG
ncbi:MAG: HAMP domain-containing protein [Planctomycetes bacterium]|nr:HAMP domain-containing protein [Planctomycetota bacterium]